MGFSQLCLIILCMDEAFFDWLLWWDLFIVVELLEWLPSSSKPTSPQPHQGHTSLGVIIIIMTSCIVSQIVRLNLVFLSTFRVVKLSITNPKHFVHLRFECSSLVVCLRLLNEHPWLNNDWSGRMVMASCSLFVNSGEKIFVFSELFHSINRSGEIYLLKSKPALKIRFTLLDGWFLKRRDLWVLESVLR